MDKAKLNHAPPKVMEERHLEEARQMTYQQRYEKLIAIIELSTMFKTATKYTKSK